jgi:hypothetical protein
MLLLVGIGLLAVPATTAAAPLPAATCENVEETWEGWSIPEFDADGNFVGNEVFGSALGGSLAGVNTVTRTTPGGTLHFTGALSFENTAYDNFQAASSGILTPSGNLKITVWLVNGESGIFTTHGTFSLSTGEWQIQVRGRICA